MLSDQNRFKEKDLKKFVTIKGIPRKYFVQIIQYLYSDQFQMTEKISLDYFLNLLIFTDYFMMPRMSQLVSSYITALISTENVTQILLVANTHNAPQLVDYCTHYICIHECDIKLQDLRDNSILD